MIFTALLYEPLGLVLDPDAVRDPVDVVEVRDDLDRVRDRHVVVARVAEGLHVVLGDRRGREGELDREVAERPAGRVEPRSPVIVRRVLHQLVRCALGTEVVRMRTDSVVALVGAGDHDGQKLPVGAREARRPLHHLGVQVDGAAQDGRPEAHRLDDVEHLPGARNRRVVLARAALRRRRRARSGRCTAPVGV